MKIKLVLTFIILIFFSALIFYISGLVGLLEFILSIILYTIIFFLLHFIWAKIRKKNIMYFSNFIIYFLQRVSMLLVFIVIFFGGTTYLLNEKYPAPMPEYTISDGKKIVTFQGMSHIGTESFYNQIVENIKEHKNNGGVYFFEGVRPGSKESEEKFNEAMGITFDKDLYKNFSKLYGVTNQDNNIFLGHINDLDFNIDLNMDQIVELYEEKINSKSSSGKINIPNTPLDASKTINKILLTLNERELKILVYINQAILNFIIGNDGIQSFLANNFTNEVLFEVILDKRDEILSEAIINSEYNDIYITYGLLHFKGVFEMLQQNNPEWKIISTKNLYPIK